MAVAMAQVRYRIGQARHGAVGPHGIEPHGGHGHRFVRTKLEVQHGAAHQIHALRQRCCIEGERARVVASLVAGKLGAEPDDAVFATVRAGVLRGRHHLFVCAAFGLAQTVRVQVQPLNLMFVCGPHAVTHPSARNVGHRRARPSHVHDVGAMRGVPGHTGVDALEPLIPPAQGFLQKPDARLGHGKVRVLVRPRTDDAFDRRLHTGHEARHGVGVRVVPAADGQHGGVYRAYIFTDGPVLPVRITVRMFQPGNGQ